MCVFDFNLSVVTRHFTSLLSTSTCTLILLELLLICTCQFISLLSTSTYTSILLELLLTSTCHFTSTSTSLRFTLLHTSTSTLFSSSFPTSFLFSASACTLIYTVLLYYIIEVEVEVNLRQTISQPVCLGVELPSGAHEQIFFGLTIAGFLIWGTLSGERLNL
jgi:hypothetical protein